MIHRGKWRINISRNIVENPETTDALPDGILLSVWQAQNQLGQTTVYELLKLTKLLGIEPEKVKLGGSKPVTLLVGKSLQVMDKLLAQHLAGKSLPALRAEITVQSELAIQAKMTTAESIHKGGSLMQISDPEPAGPLNVAELLKRLNAASLAQSTGLPLNKAEIEWIMGNRLDTETVKQSRCKIEKRGTKWTIL